MKFMFVAILIFSAAALSLWALDIGEKYSAQLVRCVDGDTARFIIAGHEETVRFLFVDTPESTRKVEQGGKEAANYTCKALQQAQKIELETDGPSLKGKYGRLLAWVWTDGNLLQEELAKAGHVKKFYDYGAYKYEDRIRRAMPLQAASTTVQPAPTGLVKKSKSGICHSPSSSWYQRTKNYTPYDDLKSCLASGGRQPKR